MTDQTTTDTAAPEREEYDTETFGVGEPCGVCIFPVGPGEICGNVVYANTAKGRLPKYCGQEGQAEWQTQHGTEGNVRHKSDLAGYPRRQLKMTKEEVQALADAETARRGITRRLKTDAAPVNAAAETDAAPVAPLADLGQALPDSPIDALAELARLIAGRVVAARAEMDDVRTTAERRAAEIEAEGTALIEGLERERAELEADRAEAQAVTTRAQGEIRAAEDARLRAEGELTSAQRRIAELERALADADARRVAEVEEVRRFEREEFRRTMREFAATVRGDEPATVAARELPEVTDDAVKTMAARVEAGHVTRRKAKWHLANAAANRAAARVLDHMDAAGYLHIVGDTDPELVTLSASGQTLTP
ncbi:hypothetical protein IU449_28505 [Nocardia higoensis]|uniref:Uncharacterized protein n=1 Tax=Nocardia higoensis TaxID=228599 RepID=A0ABS0DLL2_9NOCA|nr:hypothetical protein [Nocardia higoensis]MBF6358442.1 hypothetical protein [Nocardia higoensis]